MTEQLPTQDELFSKMATIHSAMVAIGFRDAKIIEADGCMHISTRTPTDNINNRRDCSEPIRYRSE